MAVRPELLLEAKEVAEPLTFRAVLPLTISDPARQLACAVACIGFERLEEASRYGHLPLEVALPKLGDGTLELPL